MTGGANDPTARRAIAALHCTLGAPRLPDGELRERLALLPGWKLLENRIEKTFRFRNYDETIAFVNAIATIAQHEDHHPDLSVHYDRCTVAYSTHSASGVTLNDIICAVKVEGAIS